MRRRAFLATAGVLSIGSLAGCSGNGDGSSPSLTDKPTTTATESPTPTSTPTATPTSTPTATPTATPTPKPDQDDDGVPDAEDDFPEDPDLSTIVDEQEETVNIPEDDKRLWPIDITEESAVGYDAIVRSGPAIDIFVLTEAEALEYENGNRFEFLEGTRQDTTGAQVQFILSAGKYFIIADNTSAGEASPPTDLDDSIAEVEMQIAIAR